MADYYADSSVLVKRHIREAGTDWFRTLADPSAANVLTTARISVVEVYSALSRRVREAVLIPTQYAEIIADFAALCMTEYEFVELTPDVIARTRFLLERYPLRAYDAVQLASALSVQDTFTATGLMAPIFLAADERLLNAAGAEGLAVDNPNWHT